VINDEPAEASTETSADAAAGAKPKKGRFKRWFLPIAMRYTLLRQGIGIQVVYRSNTGGLIGSGLSYAALFALIPTIILVVAGIYWLVDDPGFRQEAVDLINRIIPAFSDFTEQAVDGAAELTTGAGLIALVGFMWGASGLYLNLTRGMERFFPGDRVSGVLARIVGVLLVLVMIIAVLVAVFVAGVVTVVARALQLDAEWILTVGSAAATFLLAAIIVYAIYRVIPANPPSAHSARLPAILVGVAIALMTVLYGVLSPLLVSGFAMFGVMASVFVALVWLRVVFMAMVYGAAMACCVAMSSGSSSPSTCAAKT
jgi:membrane protein